MSGAARAPDGFALPPHSIEAEQAVLGGVLINNLAYHSVSRLRADHFYEPLHGYTWGAIGRIIDQGRVADFITVEQELLAWARAQGQQIDWLRGYLGKLVGCAESILNVTDYAEHLIELAGRRRLAELAHEIRCRAMDLTCTEGLHEQLAKASAEMGFMGVEFETREPWGNSESLLSGMAKRLQRPTPRHSTGLVALDQGLSGGLGAGQVYGFEARPKGFKTGTLGTIALALMRQQVPFLFVALEMGSDRILERMVSHVTGCNAVRFRKRENPSDLIQRCVTFTTGVGRVPAYFADEPGISFDRLRALASEAVLKLGIQVLFIDYWQLVTGQKRGTSSADHLTAVAQWMAEFASRQNVTVLVTSQTNRDGFGYGSDGLAKACDWIGRLHKVEGPREHLWIEVLHNRDGGGQNIGSEDQPAFEIDMHGPVLIDKHVPIAQAQGIMIP